MPVDQILIALQFRRTVAPDALVPIRVEGVIEYVSAQIHDSVGWRLVLKDQLVHLSGRELVVELARGRETVRIEVALADREHIHKHEKTYSHHRLHPAGVADVRVTLVGLRSVLRNAVGPEDQAERDHDQNHRPPCVHRKDVPSVRLESIHDDVLHLGVGPAGERAGDAWNHGAEQTESCRQGKGYPTCLQELFL